MKELLREFLSNILKEERVVRKPGTVWQTASKKWSAKRNDGTTESGFESEKTARNWLVGGSKKGVSDTPSVVKKTSKKSSQLTEPTPRSTEPKKIRAPKKAKSPIEKISSDREVVKQSFTDTSLDVEGLLRAVEGVESQEKGEKGAGTVESTAGEAATTLALEKLRSLRTKTPNLSTNDFIKQSMPEVVKLLSELRGIKGSTLSEDWAEAARKQVMAIFETTESKYNTTIDTIAWDNTSGRSSLGLGQKPKSDRADLYIKTKDGKIIGVSLKKDGNIFLANQGLRTTLDSIAEKSPTPETAEKITQISETHSKKVESEYQKALLASKNSSKKIKPLLSRLTRSEIGKDVSSSKYDKFFTKQGTLTPEVVDLLTSGGVGTGKRKGQAVYTVDEKKFFLKTMAALVKTPSSETEAVRIHLEGMRSADKEATQELLKMVQTDSSVAETMTDYLIDALDLVQLVTPDRPFGKDYPVDKFFIAYGEANVQPDGQEFPMSVTRETILSTLGVSADISDEELKKVVKEKFIVDAEDAGRVGFLRLRIKNDSPPPNYFYPSISTLSVRSKGLGSAASMLLEQHSGWTYTLLNKNPDPRTWAEHQKISQATDSIKFLNRQLNNPMLTDEQKTEVQKDLDFYKTIVG